MVTEDLFSNVAVFQQTDQPNFSNLIIIIIIDFVMADNITNMTDKSADQESQEIPATADGALNTGPKQTPEKPKKSRKRSQSQGPPRQQNLLWNYATKFTTASGSTTASCNIPGCKNTYIINKSSSWPIKCHLQTAHGKVYAQYLKDKKQQEEEKQEVYEEILKAEEELEPLMKMPKTSIASFFPSKYALGDKRQLKFDKGVIEYLVETSLPFGHVETDGFKNFVATLDPRVNIKCAKTFSTLKLPKLYEAMKVAMNTKTKKDFSIDIGVSFTTDCWTSRANDPFLSLTMHYISPEWELVKLLVVCMPFEGRHTSQRMAVALDEAIQSIHGLNMDPVKSPKVVVHDAAANMIATTPKSSLGLQSFVCLDHRLQTMLKKVFKAIPELDGVLKKATKLASRCHQSALTCEKIKEEAKKIDDVYVKVVAPVVTRWNSNFMMISSIVKMKRTLLSLVENKIDLDVPLFNIEEFWCLEQMEEVFGKLDAVSQELSSDKSCTMPNVLVHLYNLTTQVEVHKNRVAALVVDQASEEPNERSRDVILDLLKKVQHHLEIDFPDYGSHDELIRAGQFVHPFFRGAMLKKFSEFDKAIDHIIDNHPSTLLHNEKIREQQNKASQDLFDETVTDDLNDAELLCWELEREEKEESGVDTDEEPPMREEIDRYLRLPKPAERTKVDILQWWRDHEKTLPLLSHYAKGILAIPASSASSERTFSAAGNIVTAQRYNLDPKTTQTLTWCQQNWRVLKKPSWNIQDELDEPTEDAEDTSQPFVTSQASGEPQPGPSRGESVRSSNSSVGSYKMTPRQTSQHY